MIASKKIDCWCWGFYALCSFKAFYDVHFIVHITVFKFRWR